MSTQHPHSAESSQRRLAPLRAELLPSLSPGRAPRRAGRYVDQPRRIQMRGAQTGCCFCLIAMKDFSACEERRMSNETKKTNEAHSNNRAIDRRKSPPWHLNAG